MSSSATPCFRAESRTSTALSVLRKTLATGLIRECPQPGESGSRPRSPRRSCGVRSERELGSLGDTPIRRTSGRLYGCAPSFRRSRLGVGPGRMG